jgi:ATP-dependent DNA helicase DinG
VGLLFPADIVLSSGTITKQTPAAVGMKTEKYVEVESPFDPNRVRLYIPKGLGMPKGRDDKSWAKRAWEEFGDAITTLGGRTMILTTSHLRCEEFTEIAQNLLPFDYSVYSQSHKMSKAQLIELFKRSEKSVLVGTTSFWEGVDIPGDDLNLVVIEKLPFPQPNDPIFKAREEFVKERGGNAFMEVNVDYASVMLAQGTGRLIRATGDIGGIVILDDRALTTRYAPAVTALLPAQWKVTSSRPDFLDWIKAIAPESRNEERLFIEKNAGQWSPIGVGRKPNKRPALTHR